MPTWMQDEGKWKDAKAATRRQYPNLSEDDDEFLAISASIYREIGGQMKKTVFVAFRKARVQAHSKGSKLGRVFDVRSYERKPFQVPKDWKPIPHPYWGYCESDDHRTPQHGDYMENKGKGLYLSRKLCKKHLKRFIEEGY